MEEGSGSLLLLSSLSQRLLSAEPVLPVGAHLGVRQQALVEHLDDGLLVHAHADEDELLPMVAELAVEGFLQRPEVLPVPSSAAVLDGDGAVGIWPHQGLG